MYIAMYIYIVMYGAAQMHLVPMFRKINNCLIALNMRVECSLCAGKGSDFFYEYG